MRRKAEAVETGSDEIVVKNKTAKKVFRIFHQILL